MISWDKYERSHASCQCGWERSNDPTAIRITIPIEREPVQLSNPEGDFCDEVAPKTVTQVIENFFSPIANNLAQPNVAIHRNEQSPFAQTGGLRMSHDLWIEKIIPNLNHLRFSAAPVNAQVLENSWHQIGRRTHTRFLDLFQWSQIDASPLSKDFLTRGFFAGAP